MWENFDQPHLTWNWEYLKALSFWPFTSLWVMGWHFICCCRKHRLDYLTFWIKRYLIYVYFVLEMDICLELLLQSLCFLMVQKFVKPELLRILYMYDSCYLGFSFSPYPVRWSWRNDYNLRKENLNQYLYDLFILLLPTVYHWHLL